MVWVFMVQDNECRGNSLAPPTIRPHIESHALPQQKGFWRRAPRTRSKNGSCRDKRRRMMCASCLPVPRLNHLQCSVLHSAEFEAQLEKEKEEKKQKMQKEMEDNIQAWKAEEESNMEQKKKEMQDSHGEVWSQRPGPGSVWSW